VNGCALRFGVARRQAPAAPHRAFDVKSRLLQSIKLAESVISSIQL
jgi:hypothetical protein